MKVVKKKLAHYCFSFYVRDVKRRAAEDLPS